MSRPNTSRRCNRRDSSPSVNDIIGAKVQDITPEFIEEARKHGFKDLTLKN